MMLLGILFLALLAPVEPFKLSFKRPVEAVPPPPPPPQPELQPTYDHLGPPLLPEPPRPQPIVQQHEEIEQAPIKGAEPVRRPILHEAPRAPTLAYVIIRPFQSGLHQPVYSAPLNLPLRHQSVHPPPCHPGEEMRFGRFEGPMCYSYRQYPLSNPCWPFYNCETRGTKGRPQEPPAPVAQLTKGGMPPRDEPQPPPPPPPQPEPFPEVDEFMAMKQSKLAKLKSHLDKLTAKFSTSYHYAGEELIPFQKPLPPRPEVQAPIAQVPTWSWQTPVEQQHGWDEQERDNEPHQQQEQLPERDLGTKQPQQLEETKQERPLGLKTQQLETSKPDLGVKLPQQQIEPQKPERETGLKQQQQIELPKQEPATKERENALKERPQLLVAEETRKNGESRRELSRLASNHVAPPSSSSSLASSGPSTTHSEAGFEASVRRSGA